MTIELESIRTEVIVAWCSILSLPLPIRNRTNDGTVNRRVYIITYSPMQYLSFSVDGISFSWDDSIALVALSIPDVFWRIDPANSLPKYTLFAI
jgi:hypothetical protein